VHHGRLIIVQSGQFRIAMRRSDSTDTSASCTSGRHRVTSSTRATRPDAIAPRIGEGTRAARLGPLASSIA
jgi:hypothetical protein